MTPLYNDDTRENYVKRAEYVALALAESHYDLGNERSMWLHLFTYAQAEDIYGLHYDWVHSRERSPKFMPKETK